MAPTIYTATHIRFHLTTHISPQKDDRLSWVTCSGWFTDNSGHPSAASQAWDRESLLARDQNILPLCNATNSSN